MKRILLAVCFSLVPSMLAAQEVVTNLSDSGALMDLPRGYGHLFAENGGYSNGLEAAIGTDYFRSDSDSTRRLVISSTGALSFGFATGRQTLIDLRLVRGDSLGRMKTTTIPLLK